MTPDWVFGAAVAVALALRTLARQTPQDPRHSELYESYLRSPEWAARRARWIRQAHGRCADCRRRRRPLTIHHLTYERLGAERDEDVLVLCWPCHEARHDPHGTHHDTAAHVHA